MKGGWEKLRQLEGCGTILGICLDGSEQGKEEL